MSLFRLIQDGKLERIRREEFGNEKELQNLIEKNLNIFMGVRLIASEYPIPNGRIDTLGLDEDDTPVILEYKWKKDLSAIVQGLFYLNWIMENKKPFESIVKDKIGKDVNVNWSYQPRLIIIAQDFDIKELSAINLMGPNVELKKYSLYDGLFNIEDVNIVKNKPSSKITNEKVLPEIEYNIEHLLNKSSPKIQEIFSILRDKILSISDAVWEKVSRAYCDYRTNTTFASVNVQKLKLKIFIKMGDIKINDPKNMTKPIPSTFGYGLLNTQFEISEIDHIEYAIDLIMQAYNFVTG